MRNPTALKMNVSAIFYLSVDLRRRLVRRVAVRSGAAKLRLVDWGSDCFLKPLEVMGKSNLDIFVIPDSAITDGGFGSERIIPL